MSIITADKVEQQPKHRSLIFENVGSNQENLSLYIYDRSNPKNKEGAYKIPLYQAQPQEVDSDVADIELVHTHPLIFDTKDESNEYISPLSDGYVYVFVDGYLWRELKVIVGEKDLRLFSDVNLAFQKGFLVWKTRKNKEYANQGRREATCEQLTSIIVPNKIRGKQCKVEMAYSEVQWSWTQILKLGGMNPEDPRLNQGQALSENERTCPDRTIAAKARTKRMQLLDNLSDFERGFTNKGLIKNEQAVNQNISHFASEKLAPVVLSHGLHVARNHIDAILKIQIEIARVLHEIKGVKTGSQGQEVIVDSVKKAKFELAEKMINHFYQMNDAIIDGEIEVTGDEKAEKLQKEQLKFANKIKKWRDNGIDQQKLKKYLRYDHLLELSEEIKAQQLTLVELINKDTNVVKLAHCMEDFAYHNNGHYASGIDAIKDLALVLKIHPAHQYPTIILAKQDWDNLTTDATTSPTLLALVGEHPDQAPHPIAELFFGKPKKPATHNKPAGIELDTTDHKDPFNPKFSLERVQMVAADESFDDMDQQAVEQIGRRLSQALMGMSTGYLDLSLIASAKEGQAQTTAAYNQQVQGEKADSIATKKQLETELNTQTIKREKLQAQLKNAEQSLAKKVQGLDTKEAEYQKQHRLAEPEIKKLKAELGAIDKKFNKAQKSLRSINNQLAHIESKIKHLGSAHLSKNKGLMAALRIINQLENGQFTVLEMTAQDYHNGKFSEGFIALNARSRAEIARELSEEIRNLLRGQNNSRTSLVTSTGITVDTVEDVMHLRSKVNQLLEMAEKAQGVMAGEGASQLKLDVIALKEVADAQQFKTTSLAHEIEQLRQANVKLNADISKNTIANEKLADFAEATEKLANQKFLSNVTVDTLTKGNIGILGAVGLFEVINLTRSWEQFELSNPGTYKEFVGGIADFSAVVMTLAREAYVMKTGHPSKLQLEHLRIGEVNVPAQVKGWFTLTTWMYRANIAASVFSAVTSFFDAYTAIRRGDNDAAFGLATMGVGFGLMIYADAKALTLLMRSLIISSRAGWIGLLIVLVGAVIYFCFVDEELERWLKVNPWGTDAYGDGKKDWIGDNPYYCWQQRPDYAYHDLAQKLMAPQVHSDNVEKLYDTYTLAATDGMVSTYEDPTEAYFILSCPSNTAPNFINVEFAIKPRAGLFDFGGNDEEYQNIILGKALGRGQQWLQQFWDNVSITTISGGQGLRIDLNQYVCASLFKKLNTTRLTFRMRVKSYPKGRGRPVSAAFADNEFRLPVSERDEEGILEDNTEWQSTEVNLVLLNQALKIQLGID